MVSSAAEATSAPATESSGLKQEMLAQILEGTVKSYEAVLTGN